MKIGILGATGVIGRRLAPLLAAGGHEVRCLARPGGTPGDAQGCMAADILEPSTLEPALQGLDVLVNLATCIPNGRGRGDWHINDRIRDEGTRHLVGALMRQGGRCRLVQQSVAMLHQGDRLCDESDDIVGQGVLTSALVMEATVQCSELDWVVLRGAALYGPGTARDASFFARIASGEWLAPEPAQRWVSFIHVDDLAAAFALAATLPGRQVYIAADDHPTTYADLFSRFARGGRPLPGAVPMPQPLPSFRVSNRRLRQCGWRAAHPDVFSAMQAPASRARFDEAVAP